MGTGDNRGRIKFNAKQFREFYAAQEAGKPQSFQIVGDIVYDLLPDSEEIKFGDICDAFFDRVGKQYDDDSMRAKILEELKKLCKEGKVEHTRHGYYRKI